MTCQLVKKDLIDGEAILLLIFPTKKKVLNYVSYSLKVAEHLIILNNYRKAQRLLLKDQKANLS